MEPESGHRNLLNRLCLYNKEVGILSKELEEFLCDTNFLVHDCSTLTVTKCVHIFIFIVV